MKTRLWSWYCRNPLFLLPLHAGCPPQHIVSGWPLKAAYKNREEVGLGFLYMLAPSPCLHGLHVLSERHVEWEAMVDTAGSPCAFFPGLNVRLLINSLTTTVGFWGWNWQPAGSFCCTTVSAGQMCLAHIFTECSWAVCWMVAQCASRFSSNKGEKWGASAMSAEKCMNGQILSMRKEKKTQAFGLNQRVSFGSSLKHCLAVPYLLWPQPSGWRAETFKPKKVSVKRGPSLAASAAPALWVALSKSKWRGAGRNEGSTGAASLQSLVTSSWEEEERKVHPLKGCSNLFFLPPDLRKEDLCLGGKAETKWAVFVCGWMANRHLPSLGEAVVLQVCIECLHWTKQLFERDSQMP